MADEINEYTVSGTFLKNYLLEGNLKVEELNKSYQKIVSESTNVLIAWQSANILCVQDAKLLLKAAKLDYGKFIKAYSDKLKSI